MSTPELEEVTLPHLLNNRFALRETNFCQVPVVIVLGMAKGLNQGSSL